VGASKLFTLIPWNGAASPAAIEAASACAAAIVAASSSSSGRMPYPSSKSMRRSSIGSAASLRSIRW
jgi:hypothetical protein